MRAETTVVEFSSDIFQGKYIEIEGCKETVLRVSFPKMFPNDFDPTVLIEIERNNKIQRYELNEGDNFILDHRMVVKSTKEIKDNHVFPIIFKMDGQEYKLNRTKQNKLILTK